MYDFIDQRVECLCNGGRFLLWAMRGWTGASARGTCPPALLAPGFARVGALAALPDFHLAMVLLDRDARERIVLAAMDCTVIGEDEAVLVGLWRDLSRGETERVRATLALVVDEDSVAPVSRAMTAAAAKLAAAGFDLSGLSQATLKETK